MLGNEPLISVIIPVYDVEDYLEQCITSVVSQTYRNLDIILVDDGSPDRSPDICDEWGEKDDRIQVIHKENGGLSDARNMGLRCAKGEYVSFVDSDDWIDTHMLENMLDAILRHRADMAICQFVRVYSDGQIEKYFPEEYGMEEVLGQKKFLSMLLEDKKVTNHTVRKLYKRKYIPEDVFPKGKNYEDIYTMPDLIRPCKKIVYLGDAYYFYRFNENGIVNNIKVKNCMDCYEAIEVSSRKIEEICPSLKNKIEAVRINKKLVLWVTCFRTDAKDIRTKKLKKRLRDDLKKAPFCSAKDRKKKGLLFVIKYLPGFDQKIYDLFTSIKSMKRKRT